jgi:hypothetical protein
VVSQEQLTQLDKESRGAAERAKHVHDQCPESPLVQQWYRASLVLIDACIDLNSAANGHRLLCHEPQPDPQQVRGCQDTLWRAFNANHAALQDTVECGRAALDSLPAHPPPAIDPVCEVVVCCLL